MEKEALKILLADDDESDRLLFKDAFKELKLKLVIHTVNDGIQLMDYVTKNEDALPDVIFLDLNMPRKNGLECLKEIRNNPKCKKIAVAIYSTSASEHDIEETFQNGANVFIKKPNDFKILKKLLAKAVSSTYLYQHPPFNIERFLLSI